jgi:hypothetical protein
LELTHGRKVSRVFVLSQFLREGKTILLWHNDVEEDDSRAAGGQVAACLDER